MLNFFIGLLVGIITGIVLMILEIKNAKIEVKYE